MGIMLDRFLEICELYKKHASAIAWNLTEHACVLKMTINNHKHDMKVRYEITESGLTFLFYIDYNAKAKDNAKQQVDFEGFERYDEFLNSFDSMSQFIRPGLYSEAECEIEITDTDRLGPKRYPLKDVKLVIKAFEDSNEGIEATIILE